MSRILLLVATSLLSGCYSQDKPMSNDDIIREVTKCKAAGMDVAVYRDFWEAVPVRIVCVPEKKP